MSQARALLLSSLTALLFLWSFYGVLQTWAPQLFQNCFFLIFIFKSKEHEGNYKEQLMLDVRNQQVCTANFIIFCLIKCFASVVDFLCWLCYLHSFLAHHLYSLCWYEQVGPFGMKHFTPESCIHRKVGLDESSVSNQKWLQHSSFILGIRNSPCGPVCEIAAWVQPGGRRGGCIGQHWGCSCSPDYLLFCPCFL